MNKQTGENIMRNPSEAQTEPAPLRLPSPIEINAPRQVSLDDLVRKSFFKKKTLIVKADRLGTVEEVRSFLTDVETAYNALYSFEYLLLTTFGPLLNSPKGKKTVVLERKVLPSLFTILKKALGDNILPADKLRISKVNVQASGFWEFFGNLYSLEQLHNYVKDICEKKIERSFRNRKSEGKGKDQFWDSKNFILKNQVEKLKGLGYTEEEIKPFIISFILRPLGLLNKHIENGMMRV